MEVVKAHRHEDHVYGSVPQWNRFCRPAFVMHVVPLTLLPCLRQHFLRGVEAHDTGPESTRQSLREPARSAAEIEDRVDRLTFEA